MPQDGGTMSVYVLSDLKEPLLKHWFRGRNY